MAKKKKNTLPEERRDAGTYYKINKDAVNRLVNAGDGTAPEVSDEEIAKVSGRKKHRIPNLVKVLFTKWWFNGAICFFFYLGLGTVIQNQLDLLFILGAALGMCTDLLTNNMLRFFEPEPGANDKYIFISVRKFWSIFFNLIYGYVCLYIVVYLYGLINVILNALMGTGEEPMLTVGPILFGLFYLLVDLLFIGIRNTFKKMIEDAKANSRR